MITIGSAHHMGITLCSASDETLTIGSLAALAELQTQIEDYLQQCGQVEYIKTIHAIRRAAVEGYELHATTLNSACERGTIANAKKLRSRWHMPKPEFETWYADWKFKKGPQI